LFAGRILVWGLRIWPSPNNDLFEVNPGNRFTIDKEIIRQIINTGQIDLIIHEMQCGVCSENDIERIQDPDGREKS